MRRRGGGLGRRGCRSSRSSTLNEDYAVRIARDWNVPAFGVGYVTRFEVDAAFVARYPVRQAGGATLLKLWAPAEELEECNRHIVGLIQGVHEFRAAE